MSLSKLRPVTVFEYWRPDNSAYDVPFEKRAMYKGVFHSFGQNYEEFETGPGNFAIAIVELEDGTVVTPEAHMIKFD